MMSMKIPFKKYVNAKQKRRDFVSVPTYVAIIMDDNGRWAKKRGLSRNDGHKESMNVVKEVVRAAIDDNIKIFTLYAFLTENWKRPKSVVDYLMKLPKIFLHTFLQELIENNVQINTIGEFDSLPRATKEAVQSAKKKTKDNDGLILNFALNYGRRFEIMR